MLSYLILFISAVEGGRDQLEDPHVNLAVDILTALYDCDRPGTCSATDLTVSTTLTRVIVDEQKTLCQLLSQLQIGPGLDLRAIQKLNILLSNHEEV